jgi:predicted HD phosphohydrolase
MSEAEIADFLGHPAAPQALELRRIDDGAKVRGAVVVPPHRYLDRVAGMVLPGLGSGRGPA